MIIETSKNETILKFPSNFNIDDLIDVVDYLKFREITRKSKANKTDIDKLLIQIKKKRFDRLKHRISL